MPHMLSENNIVKLINDNVIQNAKIGNAEGIKYDFSLSSRILKSKFKTPVDINKLSETERALIFVEPGEVVFVLTEERLDLPSDIYVVLVPKRKLSHDGIMILGGLSVDPNYKGKLLLGVYNFSSSPFPLQPGKKIIGSHFFQLRADQIQASNKPEASIDDFPDDLIRLMEKYTPISTQSLLDKVNNIHYKFEEFKKEFRDRENWFDRFQTKLEDQERNIERLLKGLTDERANRLESDKELEGEIKNFRTELKDIAKSAYKTAAWVGIGGSLFITFLFWMLQKLLKLN